MSLTRWMFVLPTALGVLAGCGSAPEGHSPAAPQTVTVSVGPDPARVHTGATAQFAATVTGTADTSVTWDVVEAGGGAVDTTGFYTAPGSAGVFHVRATSRAAPTVTGQAAITVVPPVAVTISPRTPTVAAGGTVAFTAAVSNATNAAVAWSVPGTSCGSITQGGVYTAPAVGPATCSVVATSVEDPSKSDSATVTVTVAAPIVVTVAPSPASVNSCRTVTFTATVTGTSNTAVGWTVQEGATGGTITSAGVYTAPANAGTYHVVATSAADATRTAVARVDVTDRILSVAVSPAVIQVKPGGTVQFSSTVTTTCGAVTTTQTATATAGGQVVVQ